MQMRSELISISETWYLSVSLHDVYFRKTLYFFSLSVKYRVKNSKHEFTYIIHQDKQGFDGKKLTEGQTGRNSLHFNNTWSRQRQIGYRHTRFKLFFFPRFPVCFPSVCLSLKDSCVKLKLPGGWKLGPYLAKPINFLWGKFGGNRK